MNNIDPVSTFIDPLLTSEELKCLSKYPKMVKRRHNVQDYVTGLHQIVLDITSTKRYHHLEYYILLKLEGKSFLNKQQKSNILSLANNYRYYLHTAGNTDKNVSTVIKTTLPSNVPVIDNDSILISFDFSIESILIKRLQLLRSAKKRNLDFNLSDEDVEELLKRKTCYYTGARFTSSSDYCRTVDRIDNKKGYVKGNVVACTHGANQLKNLLIEDNSNGKFMLTIPQLKKMVSKL